MNLGKIQGVEINTEGYNIESTETIWFVQGYTLIRNVQLRKLKKRDFKISEILTQEGFQITNKKQFDLELKNLLLKAIPRLKYNLG